MKLSIIIPAYNEEEYLPETLERIRRALNASCSSEVVVVDNDSHDGTTRVAQAFGAKIFFEKEHSISKVRNTGAANATGDILVFIDADTAVADSLFQKLASVMEDERCAGGAVAVEYAKPNQKWVEVYLRCWQFWGRTFNMKQGAAQFCRKTVFDTIGGYDETIFMGEDIEFYWRLAKQAEQNQQYLYFIEDPRVITSVRRYDRMGLWKTLVFTHPISIGLFWRRKSFWKAWYEKAIR